MSDIRAITRTEHGNVKWTRYESYEHAAKDAVAPLTAQELPKASKVMPVCFIKSDGGYIPAALQSLIAGLNLFVAPNGRWMLPYTPACYRAYPFVLGRTESGESLLCADMDSGLLGEEGEPLFEEDGPSEAVKGVLGFLQAVEQNSEQTKIVCNVLAENDLIQPWPLTVKTDEGEQQVEGIYRIDEAALNTLTAESLAEVRDAGGLTIAFCQLLSMQNLGAMQAFAKLHSDAQAQMSAIPQSDDGELDLEFLNDSGTIKF